MKCLKGIYLPKLFSLSLLDCTVRSKNEKWLPLILDFLKNHGSTLKELMLTFTYHESRANGYEPFLIPHLSTLLILHCSDLILVIFLGMTSIVDIQ